MSYKIFALRRRRLSWLEGLQPGDRSLRFWERKRREVGELLKIRGIDSVSILSAEGMSVASTAFGLRVT